MPQERPDFSPPDWGKLSWEKTPYEGVFIHKINEKFYPKTKIPEYTVMALKINPNCLIPKHIHKRSPDWKEILTMPQGGNFEIFSGKEAVTILVKHSFSKTISSGEVFGIRNLDTTPLYFYSRMEPGFTGYGEIEEIKTQ